GSVGLTLLASLWLVSAHRIGDMPAAPSRAPVPVALMPLVPAEHTVARGEAIGTGAASAAADEQPNAYPACPTLSRTAAVRRLQGMTRLRRDAACNVEIAPAGEQCRVHVTCGDVALYDGYALPGGGVVLDTAFSPVDRDPKLLVDLDRGTVDVSDEAVTSWSVKLAFASADQDR
ncbi:MAG TPA: hypothetical protein VHB21_10965, partial [Minicystis sp.]|nr:hypothetical protein [Minicystis sp.]